MSNFKSQAKRKRELAKLDKRLAKDQKRALRRAERSGTAVGESISTNAANAHRMPASTGRATDPVHIRMPSTLAEAAELWKNMKIVKPKRR